MPLSMTNSPRGDFEMLLLLCLVYGVVGGLLGAYIGLAPWWPRSKPLYRRTLIVAIPLGMVGAAVAGILLHSYRANPLFGAVIAAFLYAILRGWIKTPKSE